MFIRIFNKKSRFSPVTCFLCFLLPFLIIGFLVFLMGMIALLSGTPGPTVTVNGVPDTSPEVSIIFGLIFMVFPSIIILPMFFFFKFFSKLVVEQSQSVRMMNLTSSKNEISHSNTESTFSEGRCPNCGAAVEKDEKNCFNCGVKF